MFIQTEQTPNPSTMKFLPGKIVMAASTAYFTNPEDARHSPLAERLFAVEGVTGVFFGADFISVTKADDKEWHVLKPSILGAIMEHFSSAEPVIQSSDDAAVGGGKDEEDDEIVSLIKELLETRIRPAVAQDGGDIVYHGYEDGVVYLQMLGACSGCPSATETLKAGIENMLKHYIPEVVEVRAVM